MSVFLVFIYYMVTELLGTSPAEETGGSFFNAAEKEIIKEYCKKTKILRIIAVELKDSLVARGIFGANTTETQVLSNKRFMKFLTDIIRLNLNDDCNFGTVVYDGKIYPICTDFELSDADVKPGDWKKNKKALLDAMPNGAVKQFDLSRVKLLRNVDTDAKNLVKHMGFVKAEKDTPTREAESKESVQGRVNEFMVSVYNMY